MYILKTHLTKIFITGTFILFFFLGLGGIATAHAAGVEVWWPTPNTELHGTQPFKGLLQGSSLSDYTMYWQVDGGNLVQMNDNYQDYPHKEASVDVSGWNWRGTGPYVLTFVAKDKNGQVISQTTRTISTGPLAAPVIAPAPAPISQPTVTITPLNITTQPTIITTATPVAAPAPAPAPTPAPVVVPAPAPAAAPASSDPLAGKKLYVDTNNQAANAVKTANPTDAALLKKIADNPQATWLGNWYSDAQTTSLVSGIISSAKAQNTTPTFVLYNIPQRDCGSYSAGGANNPDGYRAWVATVANAIGNNSAIVILEPDALAQSSCLNSTDKAARMTLLKDAVTTLKAKTGIAVYIDAGHSGWIAADAMANLLTQAGVAQADGFSLNVSNYQTTSENTTYGKDISGRIGNKHFVIDTSRNGNGSNGEWCNPSGRALGAPPTTSTGDSLVDADLWIKNPGESDGTCNGGPSAGTWWTSYALGLASLAKW